MNTFTVGAAFSAAWALFKQRPWFLIGSFLVLGVVSGISSSVAGGTPGEMPNVLLVIINFIIQTLVYMGMYSVAIKAHDNIAGASFSDLWHPQNFLSYLVASILTGVIIVIGFVLLIIPGIIAILFLMFVPYLVIDKGAGPIEAIKGSVSLTKGHLLSLFLFLLAIIAVNILGAIALLVGLLVSAPISMLAVASAYRTLSSSAPASPPPATHATPSL